MRERDDNLTRKLVLQAAAKTGLVLALFFVTMGVLSGQIPPLLNSAWLMERKTFLEFLMQRWTLVLSIALALFSLLAERLSDAPL